MKRPLVVLIVIVGAIVWVVVAVNMQNSPRQKCKDAVVKEYMDADKVLQQPSDLDGFSATWNNHPPGISSTP